MAKSRSKSKSKRTTAKRGRAKSRPKAKFPGSRPTKIELRPIRQRLQADLPRLSAALAARMESQPELEEALKRMSRWLDDIQEICGPDMTIPLPTI